MKMENRIQGKPFSQLCVVFGPITSSSDRKKKFIASFYLDFSFSNKKRETTYSNVNI